MLQDFSWERYNQQELGSFVPTPSYRCPIAGCRDRYPSLAILTAHCANVHYTVLPSCDHCGKAFISEMYLKAHMQAKHPRTIACTRCSQVFAEGGAMVMHQWMVHPGSRCQACEEYVYQDDMAEHLLNSPNHPICAMCNVGYNDSSALYDHMALIHPELCCSLCHMIFSTTDYLREHHRTTRRHPSCIHCSVGFSSDTFLKRHNALMHTGTFNTSTVTSDTESTTTSASSSLASSPKSDPLMLMHSDRSLLHSPTKSPKTFTNIPRAIKIVECNVCDIRFSQRKKLQKHYYESRKHPVCAPCDIGFEGEEAYRSHVAKTHPPRYLPPPTLSTIIPEQLSVNLPSDTPELPSLCSDDDTPSTPLELPMVDPVTRRCRSPSFPNPPSSLAIRIPGSPTAIHIPLCSRPVTPVLASRVNSLSISSESGDQDLVSVLSGETAVTFSPSSDEPSATEQPDLEPILSPKQSALSLSQPPATSSVPCRMCLQPSSDPIVTICGHIFCHKCIMTEISENLQCPVCRKVMFVRLDLGSA